MNPKVSVCVITHNHQDFIAECLESVLMQKTDFEFEIVIGELNSLDLTRSICEDYLRKFPDIIRLPKCDYTSQPIKGRFTGRYNFVNCLKFAKGEYIALIEGDDYWIDTLKLQKQLDFLESNLDCVSCHHWHKYAVNNGLGDYIEHEAPIENEGYLPKEKASVESIFANEMRIKSRTHMFRNIELTFPDWFYEVAYGDVPFSMLLGKYGQFGFIDEPMAVYRQTKTGLSRHGAGQKDYEVRQSLYWIEIWELASLEYNQKYWGVACKTIKNFISQCISRNHFPFYAFGKIFRYFISDSKLSTFDRLFLLKFLFVEYLIRKFSSNSN